MLIVLAALSIAADTSDCTAAAAFLRTTQRMQTIAEPDTIDDWRTHRKVVGCRVTAAGGTTTSLGREAAQLYERLRAAGWTRTPDPADSPNEGSLRYRLGKSDCLFNVNSEARLFTTAEDRVNEALVLKPGETRYQIYVMCMPAMPAGPPAPDR